MPAPGPTRSSIGLEPGGKSARVVLEDVDLNLTIERTLVSAWTNSGRSAAWTRMIVPVAQHDEIVRMLIAAAAQ